MSAQTPLSPAEEYIRGSLRRIQEGAPPTPVFPAQAPAAPPEQPPRVMRLQEFMRRAQGGQFKGEGRYWQFVGHYSFFAVLSSGAVREAKGRCPEVLYVIEQELLKMYLNKNPWVVETEMRLSGDELEIGGQTQ